MYRKFGKRVIDLVLIIPGLLVAFTIMIPTAVLIYLSDRGNVFYNANRLGKDGKVFKMYKFRSMKMNAPDLRKTDGSTFNSKDDPRLTKVGKFIRKTSIDELPQLLNVIKGDMSLIGPRPDLPEHIKQYKGNEARKLEVKPGITGYSQAYFRNSVEWKERIQNDIYYIDNISFWMDVKIFFKTLISVMKSDNVFVTKESKESNEIVVESTQGFSVKELQWDTENFGVKSGRVDIYKELSEEEKNLIKEEVEKYEFITVSNANGCCKNDQFISEIGGYLVDVNIQLSKKVTSENISNGSNNVKINNNYSYKEAIVDIAKNTFEKSRFLNDKNINFEKSKDIYPSWVRNSFDKNEKYFVTKSDYGKVIGFIIFSKNSDNSIVLELVGIDKNKKGMGIGKELMVEVDKYCVKNNVKLSCVGTQIENVNAINFYNRCGYNIRNITYMYHMWNK